MASTITIPGRWVRVTAIARLVLALVLGELLLSFPTLEPDGERNSGKTNDAIERMADRADEVDQSSGSGGSSGSDQEEMNDSTS